MTPPSSSSSAKTSDPLAKAVSDNDIVQLFQLCLGRSPNEEAIVAKRGQSLAEVLERLITSKEFEEKIQPTLGSDDCKLRSGSREQREAMSLFVESRLHIGGNVETLSKTAVLFMLLRKRHILALAQLKQKRGIVLAELPKKLGKLRDRYDALAIDKGLPLTPGSKQAGPTLVETATDGDIVRLFQLCLGRSPNQETVAAKRGETLASVFRKLLESKEFIERVVPALGTPETKLRAMPVEVRAPLDYFAARKLGLGEGGEKIGEAALLLGVLQSVSPSVFAPVRKRAKLDLDALLLRLKAVAGNLSEATSSSTMVDQPASRYQSPLSDKATKNDIHQLFQLCLGRSASEKTVADKEKLPIGLVIQNLLESTEFQEVVLPSLGTLGEKLHSKSPEKRELLNRYLMFRLKQEGDVRNMTETALLLSLLEGPARQLLGPLEQRNKIDVDCLLKTLRALPQKVAHATPLDVSPFC